MAASDAADAAVDEENEDWIRGKPKRLKAKKRAIRQAEVREEVEKRIKSDTEHKNREMVNRANEGVRRREDELSDFAKEIREGQERSKERHFDQSARRLQREQSAMGKDVNYAQALEFVKQREAQSESLQNAVNNEVIGNQDKMTRRMDEREEQLRHLKKIGQQNRTAMSNGLN